MPKSYSTSFQKTINAVSSDEFPLILLEIDHPDLVTPIRVVNDATDLTHNANTFQGLPFSITLPDDGEQGMPQAQLSVMNVGKELVQWIELTDFSKRTLCKIIQVMRSNPNVAEFEMELIMTDIQMTSTTISAKLGYEDLFGSSAVNIRYSPVVSPGLF